MSFFPASKDLTLYAGDTLEFSVTYKEGLSGSEVGVDLTGATLAGSVATAAGVASAADFTVTADADQDANPGKMSVALTAAESGGLTGTSYVWDLQITWADNTVQTILRGAVSVTQDVTA